MPKTLLQNFYFPFSEVKGEHLDVPSFVWTSAWSPTDGSLWACDTYLTFFFTLRVLLLGCFTHVTIKTQRIAKALAQNAGL